MASKKAGGSTRNGRDSEAKRLGVKAYGNELHRQRDADPGVGPGRGVDHEPTELQDRSGELVADPDRIDDGVGAGGLLGHAEQPNRPCDPGTGHAYGVAALGAGSVVPILGG